MDLALDVCKEGVIECATHLLKRVIGGGGCSHKSVMDRLEEEARNGECNKIMQEEFERNIELLEKFLRGELRLYDDDGKIGKSRP